MSAMKQSRLPLIALPVVVLALIVVGCAGPTEVKGRESNRTDPFSSRMEGGEGAVV
jgi:hypothetical protein